jgi:uncharacterized membrane protein YbhN (UPF0104 family)
LRGIKLLVTVAILVGVGWQIKNDLQKLDFTRLEVRPGWMLASALVYLIALTPCAWFWRLLHLQFGYPLSIWAAGRAHYIGQLGKYVPGKALAILIRSALVHPYGVPKGVSIIATFYEVLTGMAAGAIVAALIYMVEPPGDLEIGVHPFWIGAALVGVCGIPLLPGVFNLLVAKLTARIQAVQLYRLPPIRFATLSVGLLTNAVGWWVQGLSWWMMLQAVMPTPPELSASMWAQCTASIAFANVAGFVSAIPGGLGVREVLLRMLLSSIGEVEYIFWAAILLRLDWIAAEIVFALCTYWLKPAGEQREPAGSNGV